jgi:hypothetical protein
LFLKKRNKTETGSNRPVLVRFFRIKTGLNRFGLVLARFFLVWLGFFGLARFFPVGSVFSGWLGFFSVFFGLGSILFFSFRVIKPKPNQTGQVF